MVTTTTLAAIAVQDHQKQPLRSDAIYTVTAHNASKLLTLYLVRSF